MNNKDINILIVDDEFSVRDSLYKWFKSEDYNVATSENAAEATHRLEQDLWDIVLLDIKMPGMDGIEFNRYIQKNHKNTIVILITAYASVETAVQALKEGAYEYISKPIDPENLMHIIRNAIEKRLLTKENVQLRQNIDQIFNSDAIAGNSKQLKKALKIIPTVAKTDSTVMIRGESGTGKELVARAIHSHSHRRYAPIISMNCGAFTDTLLESELFGHEKGAFTGANRSRMGKFERVNNGTIFFDEIGNISMKMQMDLLRVLETKRFTRLGGDKSVQVDFRAISASNHDLEKAVNTGEFREDLYFRLNVVTIELPPLRDRDGDIPLLARFFLNNFALSMARPIENFTPKAMDMLENYEWP